MKNRQTKSKRFSFDSLKNMELHIGLKKAVIVKA